LQSQSQQLTRLGLIQPRNQIELVHQRQKCLVQPSSSGQSVTSQLFQSFLLLEIAICLQAKAIAFAATESLAREGHKGRVRFAENATCERI